MTRAALAFFALLLIAANPVSAQLDRALEAHGGLAKWRNYSTLEYDVVFQNAKGTKQDHELYNLHSRDGLITADAYALGANKGEVWIKPSLDALGGTPPRFYMWTAFYFFNMPFVFADPGATQESLGKKNFQGQEYDVVKITFKAGTGDSPDDFYTAYFEPNSARLKLAAYVVTYPSMRKGKPVEQLAQHAIVFDEWQTADGLTVPKSAQYYVWQDGNISGAPLGKLSFDHVRFAKDAPDPSKFAKPAEAVIAPLQ
ncbi:MAG: DUF6503 family protein [Chthoniobacterales bacterium]